MYRSKQSFAPGRAGRASIAIFLAAAGVIPAAMSSAQSPSSEPPAEARPNVIWILLDALRADNLSGYGYERPTSPILDKLAESGVLFEQHFTQGLWTSISVPSYMTGRYFPVVVHEPARGTTATIRKPPPGERLISEIMRANGYRTAMITAHGWFTPKSRLWKSFDETIFIKPSDPKHPAYAPLEEVNQTAFAWLQEHGTQPFFLYMHLLDTHFPHILDPPYDIWLDPAYTSDRIVNGQPVAKYGNRFTWADQNHLRGLYDGGILHADAQLGLLLDKLRELSLRDNTIVIVSADHGELLGEDGTTWGHVSVSSDWMLHIPLIMAGPRIPKGKRVSQLTQNADIVPTIIDLLNLKTDAVTDGKSMVPLFQQENAPPLHRYIFAKFPRGGDDGTPTLVLRNEKHKYELSLGDDKEHLWHVPDTVPIRVEYLSHEPEVAAEMRAWAMNTLVPLWNDYQNLPVVEIYVALAESIDRNADPLEAIVFHRDGPTVETRTDDKWGFSRNWGQLWASGWEEKPPPLSMRFQVPNGSYLLQAELWSNRDYKGHPASACRFKVQDAEQYITVAKDDIAPESSTFFFVDVGPCRVENNLLSISLEAGALSHWIVLRGFRLLTEGAPTDLSGEDGQRSEQLRALGYLE